MFTRRSRGNVIILNSSKPGIESADAFDFQCASFQGFDQLAHRVDDLFRLGLVDDQGWQQADRVVACDVQHRAGRARSQWVATESGAHRKTQFHVAVDAANALGQALFRMDVSEKISLKWENTYPIVVHRN